MCSWNSLSFFFICLRIQCRPKRESKSTNHFSQIIYWKCIENIFFSTDRIRDNSFEMIAALSTQRPISRCCFLSYTPKTTYILRRFDILYIFWGVILLKLIHFLITFTSQLTQPLYTTYYKVFEIFCEIIENITNSQLFPEHRSINKSFQVNVFDLGKIILALFRKCIVLNVEITNFQ